MPHVTVKLWPGESMDDKQALADAITHDVTAILGYGPESVSVAIEEIDRDDWRLEVYEPDIVQRPDAEIYKQPGYSM